MNVPSLDRRTVLMAGGATGLLALLGSGVHNASALAGQPTIISRAEWGADLLPTGVLPAEDVRFLLVHHTFQPDSSYEMDEVGPMLRSIYGFHTGASKGWPDIAYNFFVDRFGRIWEGRTGSIAGPVQGSATGGNQGYSQLCCFLGDTTLEPPTDAALSSMIALLAWLADRYGVSTEPGAQVTFTSRGSNKWPAGTPVTTATIAGHRDMSLTECPGDACYELVTTSFAPMVTGVRGPAQEAATTTAPVASTVSTQAPPTTNPTTSSAVDTVEQAEAAPSTEIGSPTPNDGSSWTGWALLGGAAAAGGALVVAALRRRGNVEPSWTEMEANIEVEGSSAAVGQVDLRHGGAVWCIGRAWDEPSMASAERIITAAVRSVRRSVTEAEADPWTEMAKELARLGPPSRPDAAAGLLVAHWYRSRLELVLLGETTAQVRSPGEHQLEPRRVNTERLAESGLRVEAELGLGTGPVSIEWTVARTAPEAAHRPMEMEGH